MDQLLQKENNINYSNKQSTLDTNKNSILFYNNGNYFSFGKDSTLTNKLAPTTSSFNIKENTKKSADININSNTFLNKKRKLMTSEELELEQIERERKEVKKMIQKNMALYYRTKSGTTTIVSKIRDNIYGTGDNINKNAILNNYIKNNNNNNDINNNKNKFNFPNNPILSKSNSYALNFIKEKEINKLNEVQKISNTNKIINKTEITFVPPKKEIIEINNTDINSDKKTSVKDNNKINKDNNIDFVEEKEKEEDIIEENNDKSLDNEFDIKNDEKEEVKSNKKTPIKESSYLTKIKKLGSMSKLSLCNKIQKYTEICEEVLKEQENREGNKEEKGKKVEKKKIKKGKKFEKVEKNKRKEKSKKKNKKSCSKK